MSEDRIVTTSHQGNPRVFEGGQRTLFYSLLSVSGLFLIMLALPYFLGLTDDALADEGLREVEVILTEFTIQPTSFAFEAGDRVKFVVENRGSVVHEFRLTSSSSATAHAEGGHEGHDEPAPASDEGGDVLLLVNPRQTETLEITFDEHSTFDLVACLLPGHFEEGMTSPLSIAGVMVHAEAADAHAHETEDAHAPDAATDGHATDDMTDDHATDAATDDHAMDDMTDDHATDAATDDHAMDDMTDDHATDADDVVDREILIFMDEFSFDPSSIEVVRGETIRFTIINAGDLRHEFRFTTDHAAVEHVAGGGDDHHSGGEGDLVVPVEPGAAGTLVVTFDHDAMFDTLACFLDDHYQSGLSAPLTITP